MIIDLSNVRSTNDGTQKQIHVFAVEERNGAGGTETLTYTILEQVVTASYNFKAGEAKEVSVVHTASGTGEVFVECGNVNTRARLNVDRVPGDDGSGT